MTPNKLHGLLGMAKRAGRLCVGFDATASAVKDGTACLVLLAADASPKTEKECRFLAEAQGIAVNRISFDKNEVAAALGAHKPVAVVSVNDDGFAKAMNSMKEDDRL